MSATQNCPELLAVTQNEAARMLSLTPRTVYALRRSGRLASMKVGIGAKSKVLIPLESLRQFVIQNSAAMAQTIGASE